MIEAVRGPISGHTATVEAAAGLCFDVDVAPTVFLRRLRRLLLLRYQAARFFDEMDVRLLDRCIYATFCDCQALDVGEPARQLLRDARAAVSSPLVSARA